MNATALFEEAHRNAIWLVALWRSLPAEFWAVLYACWLLGAFVFMLIQRRPPTTTLAWLIAFIALPFISAVFYFVFGPRKLKRRRMRRGLAKDLAARLAPDTAEAMPETLASRYWLTGLAKVGSHGGDGPPRAAKRVRLFASGDDTYVAIEAAMREARETIHLEYYIFEPDAIGTRWRDLLTERASAGVAVRLLVDALGSKNCKADFWRPLEAAGGEVRQFNPPRLFSFGLGKINFRTHRKIVVIDGAWAFTGGINVTKGNSGMSSGSSAWRDTHMEIVGPPAIDLQLVFLEDWLFAGANNVRSAHRDQALIDTPQDIERWFPPIAAETGPWVQIIDSGPDEVYADIQRFYFTAISSARRRVWITTPYFVPDEAIVTALATAAARGVDVRLILPQRGDSLLVTAAAYTFAEEVAAEGVAVFEYGPRMIHAKTMVIDDELAVVGTANIDNRSFRLNFEVIAAIYDTAFTAELASVFESDLLDAKPLALSAAKQRFLPRLLSSAARLFAPLL